MKPSRATWIYTLTSSKYNLNPETFTVLSGIDLPLAPSCGSMILCSDLYRRLARQHNVSTNFLTLPGEWDKGFARNTELRSPKRPYGPSFKSFVEDLRLELRQLANKEATPDIIHAQHLGFGLSLALVREWAGRRPIVTFVHGTDIIEARKGQLAAETAIEIATGSAAIIAPTQSVADALLDILGKSLADRIRIIPWGIDFSGIEPEPRGVEAKMRVLHAGRLDTNKNTSVLVEALPMMPSSVTVTIAGDGPERSRLQRLAATLGVADRIHFMPFLPQSELWILFASHDVFVMSTSDFEAFGLVGIEAQAHGLPIVSTATTGLQDVFGQSVAYYPPREPAALASEITMLAISPSLRTRRSVESRMNARQYDIKETATSVYELSRALVV